MTKQHVLFCFSHLTVQNTNIAYSHATKEDGTGRHCQNGDAYGAIIGVEDECGGYHWACLFAVTKVQRVLARNAAYSLVFLYFSI